MDDSGGAKRAFISRAGWFSLHHPKHWEVDEDEYIGSKPGRIPREPNMSGFIVDDVGPHGLACLFEDEGDTGYFYLYEENGRGILDDLHIDTRSEALNVEEEDVDVFGRLTGRSVEW